MCTFRCCGYGTPKIVLRQAHNDDDRHLYMMFALEIVNGSYAMAYISALGAGMAAAGHFWLERLVGFVCRHQGNIYALFGFGIPAINVAFLSGPPGNRL